MRTNRTLSFALRLASLVIMLHAGAHEARGQHTMPAAEDVIVQWNNVSLAAIQTAQYRAPQAARVLAMVHAAMYDSINNIDHTWTPYHVTTAPPAVVSREAAMAAAAHRVLVSLFPEQQAGIDDSLAASLVLVPEGPSRTNGIAYGASVGDAIVALRAGDHSGDMVPYTPGSDPGQWRPTPPDYAPAMAPHWAMVTPFAMTSGSQFRPGPPPELTSAEYAEDFNEVKELGAKVSAMRTPQQSAIAMFWMDMPGTITTVGRWNRIAQQVAAARSQNLGQKARLFALLNIAMADAGIAAWDCKYEYNFWRPVTAIRDADLDDNPLTDPNAAWEPFLMTPAFPEYVSAHSLFSAAAAGVLGEFFASDNITFTIHPYMMHGMTRTYSSFSAAAAEAGMSRIYGDHQFSSIAEDGADPGAGRPR